MRPTQEDKEALQILLDEERLPERSVEFLESLHNQRMEWSPRQCDWFDDLILRWL